jgi:hypothetical protein
MANHRFHQEAKQVMLQHVTFFIDFQSPQTGAAATADFDTLTHTDFSRKKPNCPIVQYAQRLSIQLDGCSYQP